MRSCRAAVAGVAMAWLLAGCGVAGTSMSGIAHPVGPSLAQFGLAERCRADSSCSDRAFAALEPLLARLGPPAGDAVMTRPEDAPPPGRLLIIFDREPALDWRAASGAAGSSTRVALDLTDDAPYAVVAPEQAFRVDAAAARQILEALFVSVP